MSPRAPADKIKSLDQIAAITADLKRQGQNVVLCHGTFDLLHPGHIRHLAEAKRQGDVLVVTLTADSHIKKGPGRPIFNERLRAETLASIETVDMVGIVAAPTAIEVIGLIKPDIYVKGSDYARPENDPTGKIHDEVEAVKAVGGRPYYTDDITFSSSKLINSNFSVFPEETETWLKSFRARHSGDDVAGWLDRLAGLEVLVVGETIVDEYAFCKGLGKAAKDPILAFLYQRTETYAGGSLAVANHVAGFAGEAGIVTLLGDIDRREEFIRRSLRAKVRLDAVTHRNAPTLHKRRFVDEHTGAKIFELYVMDDGPLPPEVENELLARLDERLPGADVVIIPDYGHGMMTPKVIEKVCAKARFLVINTQANAGNRGFNTVSKYPRADYVCIAGHELELDTRMRNRGWRDLLEALTKRIACERFTVTLGKTGTLSWDGTTGTFHEAPALATKVVDRVGAGDAVLALTGMLVAVGAPWDVVGLLGNVAGAEMVGDLGNRVAIDKGSLSKHVISLLK
ncbi:MAG: adenylyltransferase/cytidyltransferase family protein [Alphaproteobacteria bacterium]|nr:adenylyltransferase/cytidyltransferase family protein [Alphaproteobacteria bacterium]